MKINKINKTLIKNINIKKKNEKKKSDAAEVIMFA